MMRIWDLLERYVRATERIAAAQEEGLRISRSSLVINERSVDVSERTTIALEKRVETPAPLDLTAVTEAINGVRELLGPLLASFAAAKERLTDTSGTPKEGA